jgi:hypothetical protein
MPSTSEKIAVVAPIPKASVTMTVIVRAGALQRRRKAMRRAEVNAGIGHSWERAPSDG